MKTIILNGSPKGNSPKSASYFLAKAFVRQMKEPLDIIPLAGMDFQQVSSRVSEADCILFFFPNYVHAMPGIMKKYMEQMPQAGREGKTLGFVVQAGYMETVEEEILIRYLEIFSRQKGYRYLGTVAKGEAAGIGIFPEKFGKLADRFAAFGAAFEAEQSFAEEYVREFGSPYELKWYHAAIINILNITGIGNLGWNIFLKRNKAYDHRYDRPYLGDSQKVTL
jgi:hypothetical protein